MAASTPRPETIARLMRKLADRMDDQGDKVVRRAPILAARGWPTSTNGAEGGRSSDATSSTERSALNPGPFDGVDERLRNQLRVAFWVSMEIHASFDLIMAHASDDDPVPAGTGPCQVVGCDHVCNPRKNPNDRLRSGYCRRHYNRWIRLGRPDRGLFERFTEAEDVA